MSIIKRGNKYGVKVGQDKKQHWVGTFDTRREAKAAEAQFLANYKKRTSETESCDEFAGRWVEDYPRPRAATNRHYTSIAKKFAKDFQGVALPDITRKRARNWALENRTKVNAVRAMIEDARNEGLLDSNPFAGMRLPQPKGRKNIKALTVTEVDELEQAARSVHGVYGEQYAAMIRFAAYTGMRRGEVVVLEWGDIDFDRNEIEVSKTLSNDTEVLPPKNGKPRTIVLPPQAREALSQVPRRIDTERIFSTKMGRRFSKSTFHYAWNPVRCAAGRPALDWHELRHFTATYLVQDIGLMPAEAAHQLGHSDGGKLIMELYAHPDEDRMRNAIKQAFNGSGAEVHSAEDRFGMSMR